MRLSLKCLLIIGFMLLAASSARAADSTPDSCEDSLTEKWVSMLDDLKHVETLFMESKWHYLKYWETVYNPLWQAQIKKDDQLSQTRKAEGEVLFSRYQEVSENYLSMAEEAGAGLSERLSSLSKKTKSISACCGAHDYRQCMAPRSQDILERIENFQKMLLLRKSIEIEFSARVRAAVNDRPSDHDDFTSRYQNYLQELEIIGSAKILILIRDLRESLEMNWPGQRCCKLCRPSSDNLSDDPVLSRLKPNKQGQTGADGRLVNNASLEKAFERFEESKKSSLNKEKKISKVSN